MKSTVAWHAEGASTPEARPYFWPGELVKLEPDHVEFLWRSLRYFSFYRFCIASLFLVVVSLYADGLTFGSYDLPLFFWAAAFYWVAALFFLAFSRRLRVSFETVLALQVTIDILALTLLMYASGGHKSGIPFMVLVALAGAGLIGEGRAILSYAALATIALLLEEAYRTINLGSDPAEFAPVGITCIGYFAIAIVAQLLARRVIANQELARQRGIDLANQLRIIQQTILDMHDGVLVVDAQGTVRQHNPQAEALLGMVAPVASDLSAYSGALAERFARLERDEEQSICAILAAGSGKSLQARFVSAGEAGDMLIYLEDMDRVQSRAQQLKLAALGRLTANIAHEIRNPLSAISHAAELLREEKRADTQGRLTRIINDNAQRLERLVRDVLELGRRDRAEPELIMLAPFLNGFVDEFCMHERAPRELFALDIPEEASLQFDRGHLHQVLWNLLHNARRHCSTNTGAIRMEVSSATNGRSSAQRIGLHIIDDGRGIPVELRAQVFEPFFTTESRGTGLGLYIARELCDANGAVLELKDNAPGAHFCVTGRRTGE